MWRTTGVRWANNKIGWKMARQRWTTDSGFVRTSQFGEEFRTDGGEFQADARDKKIANAREKGWRECDERSCPCTTRRRIVLRFGGFFFAKREDLLFQLSGTNRSVILNTTINKTKRDEGVHHFDFQTRLAGHQRRGPYRAARCAQPVRDGTKLNVKIYSTCTKSGVNSVKKKSVRDHFQFTIPGSWNLILRRWCGAYTKYSFNGYSVGGMLAWFLVPGIGFYKDGMKVHELVIY